MKTITFASGLLWILFFTPLFAQSKLTEQQKTEAKARYEAYREQLNLSEEQATKVESINQAYFQGLADLKNSQGSRLAKLRQYRELSSTRDKQMKGVLSREQYAIYEQQQKLLKEEFKNKRRAQ